MRTLTVPILRVGALVQVHVGVTAAARRALVRLGRPVPPHIPLNLLIDTGATSTLVDDQHMRSLGIAPTGATMLHSSSTGGIAHPCDLFAVQLVLGGLSNPATTWRIDPIEIVVLNFIGEGVDGLLGRDVLDRTQLSYNSPRGQVTLSYV